MKKSILIFALLLSAVTFVKSQTTEEEYNFITKGYKVQLESGLDMKKGYTLKDLGSWSLNFGTDGTRDASFKGLYKDNATKPCAIMLIYKRPSTGYTEYYCIPTTDAPQALWDKTLDQINTHFSEASAKAVYSTLVWSLMKFSVQQTTK